MPGTCQTESLEKATEPGLLAAVPRGREVAGDKLPIPQGEEALSMFQVILERFDQQQEQLSRIEKRISSSVEKAAYTTQEAAEQLNLKKWTVMQWCNKGQARAKKVHGRGRQGEWRISHEELIRLQSEGPMPPCTFDNRVITRRVS
jgi:excisionase family DNA binding protein